MKRAIFLPFCFIVLLFCSACKKEAERRLVHSLIGTYKLSGVSYLFGPIPPYTSDSTLITDTVISITKYDDTSLAIGGLQCQYCPQCTGAQYCFVNEQPLSWFAQLSFYSSNIDSVNFNITRQNNPASGYSIVLAGRRVR